MKNFISMRTALFVPGNRPERVDKAVSSRSDVVIIDLEDAVPLADKETTRKIVREKIDLHREKTILVRVNSLDTGFIEGDLEAIVTEGLFGVMLPKVDRPLHLSQINRMLCKEEKKKGVRRGSIFVIPLIESAAAVENIFSIITEKTEPERLLTVAFGAADYTLDMGIRLTKSGEELLYPRARIAVACRAANAAKPLDTPFMVDLKDLQALEQDALKAKQLGFGGKLCIHPIQLETINTIFSPAQEEIVFAEKVVRAFREAETEGKAAIQVEGKFVDYPVVEHSRRLLEIAKYLKEQQGG
jgi:citrate lyase subunit beta/citryl-CoA lyase